MFRIHTSDLFDWQWHALFSWDYFATKHQHRSKSRLIDKSVGKTRFANNEVTFDLWMFIEQNNLKNEILRSFLLAYATLSRSKVPDIVENWNRIDITINRDIYKVRLITFVLKIFSQKNSTRIYVKYWSSDHTDKYSLSHAKFFTRISIYYHITSSVFAWSNDESYERNTLTSLPKKKKKK